MDYRHSRNLKIISAIVLCTFVWVFAGVFDIAYAISNSKQEGVGSKQTKAQTSSANSHELSANKTEDKFQKLIDDIDKTLADTTIDHETKRQRIKGKKAEIDLHDIEIKKQFKETEGKIKDLPEVIKQRHRDFVKKYEDNSKELKTNLENIDKAKTKDEADIHIARAKAHLEKVRPSKKHKPIDPNKLPHRTAEPVFKEPRTKPEEFQKDSSQHIVDSRQGEKNSSQHIVDSRQGRKNSDQLSAISSQPEFINKPSFPLVGNPSYSPLEKGDLGGCSERLRRSSTSEDRLYRSDKNFPTLEKGGKGGFSEQNAKPILVASNGSLTGLLNSTPPPRPLATPPYQGGELEKLSVSSPYQGEVGRGEASAFSSYQIALADPPTDADLAQTIEVQFTPEIQAKAAELGHNPVKIYNWVRNNIEYVPTYGSIQGANMCLQTKQCNDMDTASLLIALLRVSGIHAKYVYGTIELPIEKVKNWAGGFTDSMEALRLFASAGVPTKGMTVGGEIKYVRLEHVWVESFIDYIPSRGEVHKQGDTWIPLDASFKQYTYTQGIDIKSAVPFDAQSFIDQITASATINETQGYVTNVSSSLIQQTMTDYQTQVQNYISQHYPNATVGDVLGKKEIIKQEYPYLLGTMPYKPIITGWKSSSIPDNLRHKLGFNVTKDIFDSEIGTPINITKSLPELAGKKITLSYSPATQADENVINSYLPKPHADGTPIQPNELPSALPAYLINLKPELRIDGVVVAAGTDIGMGNKETFIMTFSGPGANANDVITNDITSGQYLGIGLDLGRISSAQMIALKTKLEATKAKLEVQKYEGMSKDDILGDLLYTTAISYYAHLDLMNYVSAKTMGVVGIRLPSENIFSSELKVQSYWGTPFSVSPSGLGMDVDRVMTLVKSLDADKEKAKQFLTISGMNSSVLEHLVPEQLWSTTESPAYGISAVKALQIANEQGIPIYTIDQSNIDSILPQLQLDSGTITDIQNAVNAGKIVKASKTDISFNGWIGCGYIIIDPTTSAGAYMISEGMNGAFLVKSLKLFLSLMRNQEFLSIVNFFAGLAGPYGLVITMFITSFTVIDILLNTDNSIDEKLCAIAATCFSQLLQFALGFATMEFPAAGLATILMGFFVDILTNIFISTQCGGIKYLVNNNRLFEIINRKVIYEIS